MLPERIHPYVVLEFWIPHTDMATDALGEALARPGAESCCHVYKDVFAMLLVGGERRNSCETGSVTITKILDFERFLGRKIKNHVKLLTS